MNAKSSQVYEHGCYNTKTYLLATVINQHSNSLFYVLNLIMHLKTRQAKLLKVFFNLNTEQSCPF